MYVVVVFNEPESIYFIGYYMALPTGLQVSYSQSQSRDSAGQLVALL